MTLHFLNGQQAGSIHAVFPEHGQQAFPTLAYAPGMGGVGSCANQSDGLVQPLASVLTSREMAAKVSPGCTK